MKIFKFSLTNLSFCALNLCTLNLCAMEEVYYKNPFFKSSVFIYSAEKLYIVNNENCMENLKNEEFLKLLTTSDREGDLFDILENIILKNSNLIKYVPKLLNRYLEESPIEAKRIKIFQLFLTTFVKENNASCINYIMQKIRDLDAPLVSKILSQDFEKFLYNNAFRKAFLNFLFLQEKKEYEDFIYSFILNLINYQDKFNLYSSSSIELYLEYSLVKPLKYKSVFLTVMKPISIKKCSCAFLCRKQISRKFFKKI